MGVRSAKEEAIAFLDSRLALGIIRGGGISAWVVMLVPFVGAKEEAIAFLDLRLALGIIRGGGSSAGISMLFPFVSRF